MKPASDPGPENESRAAGATILDAPSSQHRVSDGLLLLYLGAECTQSCAFCALKTYQPPSDGGDAELDVLLTTARAARQSGVAQVQLEGIDPAQFSRVLQLVEGLSGLGFQRLIVTGTARRFADPAFRRDFLARAAMEVVVVAPVYGVTPEVHDCVTGSAGSFAEVRAAIDALLAERGVQVMITTVATRHNAAELSRVFALGPELGVQVVGRLPYKRRAEAIETFAGVALRESEVIEAFTRTLPGIARRHRANVTKRFAEMMPHPCLLHDAARRPAGRLLMPSPEHRARLEGVDSSRENRTEGPIATVPCRHVAQCALSACCPGEHYEAYAQIFGLDEYVPPPAVPQGGSEPSNALVRWARHWLDRGRAG